MTELSANHGLKEILVVHLKRLNKIKLEDIIAMLTLSLFLAEVVNILHRISL